jgi:hypothetical protein
MTDETTVRQKVLTEISKASGVPKLALTDDKKLRDDLRISPENVVILAQNLRAFIEENNALQTLTLGEINTASATVGSVFQIVVHRVNP